MNNTINHNSCTANETAELNLGTLGFKLLDRFIKGNPDNWLEHTDKLIVGNEIQTPIAGTEYYITLTGLSECNYTLVKDAHLFISKALRDSGSRVFFKKDDNSLWFTSSLSFDVIDDLVGLCTDLATAIASAKEIVA